MLGAVAALALTAAPAVHVSISAGGRAPMPGRVWRFEMQARDAAGRPVPGTAIVRVVAGGVVVDTVGWYGFSGTLRGSYRWPVALAGSAAIFRLTVLAGRRSVVGDYRVRVADRSGTPRFRVVLTAAGRAPVAGHPWRYSLRAFTNGGAAADVTALVRVVSGAEVRDTVGRFQLRGRLEGVYRWPGALRGRPAALQATVVGPGGSRTVAYRLRPR
jgi:hypothetical protein